MTTINSLEIAKYLQELRLESSRVVNATVDETGEIVLPRSSGCCALPDLEFLLLTIIASSLSKLDLSVSLEALAEALASLGDITINGEDLTVNVDLDPLLEVLTRIETNIIPSTNSFQILCSANDPSVKYLVFAAPLLSEEEDESLQFFHSINGNGDLIEGFPDDAIMCQMEPQPIDYVNWQASCYYSKDDESYYTRLLGIVGDELMTPIWLDNNGMVVDNTNNILELLPCEAALNQTVLPPPGSNSKYLEVCVETPINETTSIYQQVFVDVANLEDLKYFTIENFKLVEYTPASNAKIIIGSCPLDVRRELVSCEVIPVPHIVKEEYIGLDSGVSKCGDPFIVSDFYGVPQHINRGIATKTPSTTLIVSPTNESYACYFAGYITLPMDLPDDLTEVRISPVGDFDEGGTRLMIGKGTIVIEDDDNSRGEQSFYIPRTKSSEQTFQFVWQLWFELFQYEVRLMWDIGNGLEDIPLSALSITPERYKTTKYYLDQYGVLTDEGGNTIQIGISGFIDTESFDIVENVKIVSIDGYEGVLASPQTTLIEGKLAHTWNVGYSDNPTNYELMGVFIKNPLIDKDASATVRLLKNGDEVLVSQIIDIPASSDGNLEFSFVNFEAILVTGDVLTLEIVLSEKDTLYFSHLDFKVGGEAALNEVITTCPQTDYYYIN